MANILQAQGGPSERPVGSTFLYKKRSSTRVAITAPTSTSNNLTVDSQTPHKLKMIAKITAVLALIAAAAAVPTSVRMDGPSIMGQLPTGTGFSATSDSGTTAGAAADQDSGIAGASLDGTGSVLGLAGPGLALGAAIKSPEM